MLFILLGLFLCVFGFCESLQGAYEEQKKPLITTQPGPVFVPGTSISTMNIYSKKDQQGLCVCAPFIVSNGTRFCPLRLCCAYDGTNKKRIFFCGPCLVTFNHSTDLPEITVYDERPFISENLALDGKRVLNVDPHIKKDLIVCGTCCATINRKSSSEKQ